MKDMTLSQIAKACQGRLYMAEVSDGRKVEGVVTDSRLIEKDYLFIATAGERVDGHDFIPDAFKKGAMAVVCEKAIENAAGPYILVENSLIALKEIAKWYRSRLSIKVVGITGSVGKTSTKEFISSVLARKYKVLKTEGNYNNEIGLPLTILKIRDYHEAAVLEMGISNFGEMHRLSDIARPDICVITNIGQCHLENLGSREGILKAKSEIFDFINPDGSICLNGDDDMLSSIKEIKGHEPVRFGFNQINTYAGNDVFASEVKTHGLFGSTCLIHAGENLIPAEIPLPGEHMILNALAAASVGIILNVSADEIAAGIKEVKSLNGRSNILRYDKWTLIDDCYNANPISMKAAIDLLTMADTRKVAVLGDMFELGSRENILHEEVGAYAAASDINVLVCIGKLSADMYRGAAEILEKVPNAAKKTLVYFETREAFINAISSVVQENDTILVKASHGMGFDIIVRELINLNR